MRKEKENSTNKSFLYVLYYRSNGPSNSSHYSSSTNNSSSSNNSGGRSGLGGPNLISWKETPLSPRSTNTGTSSGTASDLLQVKSSNVYLNNDRGAVSPLSTCSSTSSKRHNGHNAAASRSNSGNLRTTSKLATHPRPSRRRASRSSDSGSESSGSETGSGSRSSSSSSTGSSSSSRSADSNTISRKKGRKLASTASSNQAGGTSGSASVQRPVNFEEKTNCAICIRNLPVRGTSPSGKSIFFLLLRFSRLRNSVALLFLHDIKH